MMQRVRPTRTVRYTDEVLADGTIHRRYDDGRAEWRTRVDDVTVTWQDNGGWRGTDEKLGDRVVKRTLGDGRVIWGREQGFGRTAWDEGIVTVNVSKLRGRAGWIAAAAGLALAAAAIVPARALSAAQERLVRGRRGGRGGGGRGHGDFDLDEFGDDDDGGLWWDDDDHHDALDDFGELEGGLDDDFG
jgi:hypothetical protein